MKTHHRFNALNPEQASAQFLRIAEDPVCRVTPEVVQPPPALI
jgi:hypothetical protein